MERSIKQYRFGFSYEGLISCLVPMLPNIIWALVQPANDVLAANAVVYPVWDVIASVSQWLMIAALVLLVRTDFKKEQRPNSTLRVAAVLLAGYFLFWVLYYAGVINPWLFIGMAVLPAVYFVLVGLWIKNYIATVPAAIFDVTHIALTCVTYLK